LWQPTDDLVRQQFSFRAGDEDGWIDFKLQPAEFLGPQNVLQGLPSNPSGRHVMEFRDLTVSKHAFFVDNLM
jgi:hypothetical protein